MFVGFAVVTESSIMTTSTTQAMASSAAQAAERLQRQQDAEHVDLLTGPDAFGELARHMEDEATDSDAPIITEYIAVALNKIRAQ